jgi:hypothetical protein
VYGSELHGHPYLTRKAFYTLITERLHLAARLQAILITAKHFTP